jgi:hypothetical protein
MGEVEDMEKELILSLKEALQKLEDNANNRWQKERSLGGLLNLCTELNKELRLVKHSLETYLWKKN